MCTVRKHSENGGLRPLSPLWPTVCHLFITENRFFTHAIQQATVSPPSTPPSLCVAFVYCHSHFHLQVALLQVMGTPGVSEQDPEKLHQLKIK